MQTRTLIGNDPMNNQNKIILSIDLDCFYAQCAEIKDPLLKNKPIGILQRSFVATTNYVARNLGSPKCGARADIVHRCPSIKLVQQDMALYRQESLKIHEFVREFFDSFHSKTPISIEKTGLVIEL